MASADGEDWTLRQCFSPVNRTPFLLDQLFNLWSQAEQAGRGFARPFHVSVALQDVIPDSHVIPSLFEDLKSKRVDETADRINDRFGRGTVKVAASMQAKVALDHGRIPFGKPTVDH